MELSEELTLPAQRQAIQENFTQEKDLDLKLFDFCIFKACFAVSSLRSTASTKV